MIWLSLSRETMQRRGQNFELAQQAEQDIGAARARRRQQYPEAGVTEEVTVTYTGLFETHDDFESAAIQGPDGIVGIGYGPAPGVPGQLYVQSVRDIVVEYREGKK
jgi:hypothetical protein